MQSDAYTSTIYKIVATVVAFEVHGAQYDYKQYNQQKYKRMLRYKPKQAYEEFPEGGKEPANGHCFS